MTICFLDIETIPAQPEEATKAEIAETITPPGNMSKPETIADWHNGAGKYAGEKDRLIEEAYRKTALDGGKGQIISICASASVPAGNIHCLNIIDKSEGELLCSAFDSIKRLCEKKQHSSEPFFVGHYVQFDLKFLWQRAVILGIKPPFRLPFSGRHGTDFFDNMQAWAGYGNRISQDNLAKMLGIERRPTDISGDKVWDVYKAGRIEAIGEYNQIDVETVIAVYKKIHFQD